MIGQKIILTSDPKGQYTEGVLSQAGYPGSRWMKKPQVGPVGNRFTYIPYTATNDGDPRELWILLNAGEQGFTNTTQVPSGERARFYRPYPGEEMNVWVAPGSGTGTGSDYFGVGDRLKCIHSGATQGQYERTTTTTDLFDFTVIEQQVAVDNTIGGLIACEKS